MDTAREAVRYGTVQYSTVPYRYWYRTVAYRAVPYAVTHDLISTPYRTVRAYWVGDIFCGVNKRAHDRKVKTENHKQT